MAMAMVSKDCPNPNLCGCVNDGSDLIVGFPPVPRRRSESSRRYMIRKKDESSAKVTGKVTQEQAIMSRRKDRSVSFSATSELYVLPSKSVQDLESAWLSKEEKDYQKIMVLCNAAEISQMLDTMETATQEDLCKTIGMDNYMSERIMWLSKIQKRRHTQSVVYAQAMLKPTLLAKLSKRSSLSSRQRAHERAKNQLF